MLTKTLQLPVIEGYYIRTIIKAINSTQPNDTALISTMIQLFKFQINFTDMTVPLI